MNAVELSGLVKKYGRRTALAGLDLAVPAGTVCGLVGSNGAGKTTTLGITAGLTRPDAGTVNLLGEGPFDPVRHAGRVSMLPQDTQIPHLSRVRDLLVFYATLQGIPAGAAESNADDVLARVHLTDRAESVVRTLSHGMRRRVLIAQALMGDPELVLLDEPLGGLDPREVVNIRNILLACRGRQTIVISSHNLHEVELICDHIAFIEQGRTVRQDSMSAVTSRQEVLTYRLEGGVLPMRPLAERFPDAEFSVEENGARLICRYDGRTTSTAEVNGGVLRQLLEAGVGILEVTQGSALERAYLEGVPATPPPLPAAKT